MPYFKSIDNSLYVFDLKPSGCEVVKITKKQYTEALREIERQYLLSILQPGDKVLGSVKNVSRSGMQRNIKFYTVKDGEVINITWSISRLFGETLDKNDCLIVHGCGMDMIFHTVYNLGVMLWPEGTPEPHGTRNGEPDFCGGYALKYGQI